MNPTPIEQSAAELMKFFQWAIAPEASIIGNRADEWPLDLVTDDETGAKLSSLMNDLEDKLIAKGLMTPREERLP